LDNTLYLSSRIKGAGFFEHPGFWALFIGSPAIVFLLMILCRRMASVINRFCREFPDSEGGAHKHRDLVIDMMCCRTLGLRVAFGGMMFLGFLSLLANYQNTRQARAIFGHDVWDSSVHETGFWVAKLFLAVEWIYLFPLAIYLGISAGISILLIVNCMASAKQIEILPFEPDGCGGYRPLGQAMLAVIYLNAPFAAVVVADILTHNITHKNFYPTILGAVLLLLAILLFEIFVPFVRLHSLLAEGKKARLKELSQMLSVGEISIRSKRELVADLPASRLLSVLATAELYRQTEKMQTWPYLPIDRLKFLTPLFPVAAGVMKVLIAP
jgi:hypothetical protein